MKICQIEGCQNKHHGKGYCSIHYSSLILKAKRFQDPCSVKGCPDFVYLQSGKNRMCSRHFHRLKRKGDVGSPTEYQRIDAGKIPDEISLDYIFNSGPELSKAAIRVYGNKCMECGWDKARCDSHHITPRALGGLHTIRNSIILCPNCHRIKHELLRSRP